MAQQRESLKLQQLLASGDNAEALAIAQRRDSALEAKLEKIRSSGSEEVDIPVRSAHLSGGTQSSKDSAQTTHDSVLGSTKSLAVYPPPLPLRRRSSQRSYHEDDGKEDKGMVKDEKVCMPTCIDCAFLRKFM